MLDSFIEPKYWEQDAEAQEIRRKQTAVDEWEFARTVDAAVKSKEVTSLIAPDQPPLTILAQKRAEQLKKLLEAAVPEPGPREELFAHAFYRFSDLKGSFF